MLLLGNFSYVPVRIALNNFLFYGELNKSGHALGIGFTEDVFTMCFNGPFADKKFFAYLSIIEFLGNKF